MGVLSFSSRVLQPGYADGTLTVLEEALSFWGGYDPKSGTVIDRQHPQVGVSISDRIVALPASRGSAGTPAGVAESLRLRHGPRGVILRAVDVNIAIGAAVAAQLYECAVPVVTVTADDYSRLISGQRIEIREDGTVIVQTPRTDPR